jgi:hypothetical protein
MVVPPVLMAGGGEVEAVRRGAADRVPLALESFAATVRSAMDAGRGVR